MDDATMNKLYGWKGRVHKAVKVFEQCKGEYVRVCALPNTKGGLLKSIKRTTCNHDADIALTLLLLESSRKVVDATCDGYIASIKRSFYAYRMKQEEDVKSSSTVGRSTIDGNNNNAMTLWIEGVVENTINSNAKFIEQWRDIISDAQKEVTGWKSEHEKYLDEVKKGPQYSNIDPDDKLQRTYRNDDEKQDTNDSDNIHENTLRQMEIRVDEQADRIFQIESVVSAGKILLSSLKIFQKIESIETAAQEAGTACILGLTQLKLRDRDVVLSNFNNVTTPYPSNEEKASCCKSENEIVEEWKQQSDRIKLNAVYSWYRMYHGALSCANT